MKRIPASKSAVSQEKKNKRKKSSVPSFDHPSPPTIFFTCKATILNHTTPHTLIAFPPGHHPGVHPLQPPTHTTPHTPNTPHACTPQRVHAQPTNQTPSFLTTTTTRIEPPFRNQFSRRIITQHRDSHTHTRTQSPSHLTLCDPNRGVSNYLQKKDQAQSANREKPSKKLLGIDTRHNREMASTRVPRTVGPGFDSISTHSLSTVINPSLSPVVSSRVTTPHEDDRCIEADGSKQLEG